MEGINFDNNTHTYINNKNEKLISVTQLLTKMGIAPNFENVPQAVLDNAANYGTTIHADLEKYIKYGDMGDTVATYEFASECVERDYTPIHSEYIVYDELIAGTIDCVIKDKNGNHILIDFKTSYTLDKDYVTWQLSLYKYLWDKAHPDMPIVGIEAWHFDKHNNDKLTVYELMYKPLEEIDRLINCYLKGLIFESSLATTGEEQLLQEVLSAERIIANCELALKSAKKNAEIVKAKLLETMQETGTHKFENKNMIITLVDATERKSLDTERFKTDHPELYDEYQKTNQVKASVRIKLKENK